MRFQDLLLSLSGYGVAAAAAVCNGNEKLCSRRYSDVTMIGTHNSAFVGDSLFDNQLVSVTEQLDSGVRFLQAQTHDKDGTIEMCHTECVFLDAGSLSSYLGEVADWLHGHPDEVVTLLLTNINAISVTKFADVFKEKGLDKLVFRPKDVLAKDQWPTLQELIKAKTRLVVFMDYHSDQSKVDYIMNEFDYFWETPYGVTDKKFPTCKVDRPPNGDSDKLMGIMNHMLNVKLGDIVIPTMLEASRTNSLASIQAQVDLCRKDKKPQPNVVLLDWVNIGEAQKAHEVLNKL